MTARVNFFSEKVLHLEKSIETNKQKNTPKNTKDLIPHYFN